MDSKKTTSALSFFLAVLFLGGLSFPVTVFAESQEPNLGFSLPMPEETDSRQYLGLSESRHFTLGQIRAQLVIIEIFSMYCPVCQREAGKINTLYRLVQDDPKFREKIRIIGIGAGNSAFEVNFFKEKYDIRFPLFSDSDFSLHKAIGQVRTPHFFGLMPDGKGGFKIVYSNSGAFEAPGPFLEILLKAAGLRG